MGGKNKKEKGKKEREKWLGRIIKGTHQQLRPFAWQFCLFDEPLLGDLLEKSVPNSIVIKVDGIDAAPEILPVEILQEPINK